MLSQLPPTWAERSLAELGNFVNGYAFKPEDWSDHGLPIVRISQITGSSNECDRFTGELPETFKVEDGDVIFSWSGTLAVVRWRGGSAWLNQHLFRVDPADDIDQDFLFHALHSSVQTMERRTHGSTMKHIKRGDLREHHIGVPENIYEQRLIAHILDTLDTQIRQTEKVIAKLEQVKNGLITDLLTRGIDDKGELRPPQEEAPNLYTESSLGRIPKTWDCVELGSVATLQGGFAFPSRDFDRGPIVAVRMSDLHQGRLDTTDAVSVPTHYLTQLPNYVIEPGDLLVGMSGSLDNWGVASETDTPALLNQRVGRFRVLDNERLVYRMLDLFILSSYYRDSVRAESAGAAQLNISSKQIERATVPLPPRREQIAIVEHYESLMRRIREEEKLVRNLRVIRTGLMDDLLTGRVRVTPLLDDAAQATC